MKSQRQIILEHLRKRPITAMGAFDSLGVVNLSGRIAELRQAGYTIDNDWTEARNRWGDKTRFVRYRLVKEPCAYVPANATVEAGEPAGTGRG